VPFTDSRNCLAALAYSVFFVVALEAGFVIEEGS
jgi:hypothetical protein